MHAVAEDSCPDVEVCVSSSEPIPIVHVVYNAVIAVLAVLLASMIVYIFIMNR